MGEMLLRAPEGAKKNKRRVGRGPSSGKGGTSGRGHKGQKARSGGGVRPGFEGGQMPLYRRVARRGFSNYPFKKEYQIVHLDSLNKFSDGDTVTFESLLEKRIIKKKNVPAKILANGELEKKLTVSGIKMSAKAKELIEKAGGRVVDETAEAKESVESSDVEKSPKAGREQMEEGKESPEKENKVEENGN